MKFEKNVILASIAVLVVMLTSTAFADGCCDCDVKQVTVETTYSGSGQYCMQTYVPAGEGTLFVDSVGADAENYNGYQYVTSNGNSAMSYDEANVSGGIISTQQAAYYQNGGRMTITTYGSCVTNEGTLGAFVYFEGTHSYGTFGAYGNGFICIDFSQISYDNDTFGYYINQGAGASEGGQVYAEYESFENEAWGYEEISSDSGLYWTDIETSQSLDACDEFSTDWMTDITEIHNNGTVKLVKSITTSGNSTYTYSDVLNPRTTTSTSTTTSSTTTTSSSTTTSSTTTTETTTTICDE